MRLWRESHGCSAARSFCYLLLVWVASFSWFLYSASYWTPGPCWTYGLHYNSAIYLTLVYLICYSVRRALSDFDRPWSSIPRANCGHSSDMTSHLPGRSERLFLDTGSGGRTGNECTSDGRESHHVAGFPVLRHHINNIAVHSSAVPRTSVGLRSHSGAWIFGRY